MGKVLDKIQTKIATKVLTDKRVFILYGAIFVAGFIFGAIIF
jgi:hypothetical protein